MSDDDAPHSQPLPPSCEAVMVKTGGCSSMFADPDDERVGRYVDTLLSMGEIHIQTHTFQGVMMDGIYAIGCVILLYIIHPT